MMAWRTVANEKSARWRIGRLLALVVLCGMAVAGRAQETIATTGTLLLFGEKPQSQRAGQAPTVVRADLVASATLPAMRIVDMTVDAEPVRATLARAKRGLEVRPTAVVIFTGRSDSAASGDDEKLRATLVELARTFARADVEVFLVPSATFVGADVSANLQLAADDAAVHYVEPGTEIGGDPYQSVLADVGKILAARVAPQLPAAHVVEIVAVPTPSRREEATSTVVAKPGPTPATIYMVPPPALKHFDPRETPKARKRLGKTKPPAFETEIQPSATTQ